MTFDAWDMLLAGHFDDAARVRSWGFVLRRPPGAGLLDVCWWAHGWEVANDSLTP